MRLFGDAKVLKGSVAWTNPLRLKIHVLPAPTAKPEAAPLPAPPSAVPVEFDEEGRQWVFRFARTAPQNYAIDRDRIFDYIKKRRLPSESVRQIRRDLRNAVDFFTDVRDIQTHPDVEALSH